MSWEMRDYRKWSFDPETLRGRGTVSQKNFLEGM